jgi:hypothetical protein
MRGAEAAPASAAPSVQPRSPRATRPCRARRHSCRRTHLPLLAQGAAPHRLHPCRSVAVGSCSGSREPHASYCERPFSNFSVVAPGVVSKTSSEAISTATFSPRRVEKRLRSRLGVHLRPSAPVHHRALALRHFGPPQHGWMAQPPFRFWTTLREEKHARPSPKLDLLDLLTNSYKLRAAAPRSNRSCGVATP